MAIINRDLKKSDILYNIYPEDINIEGNYNNLNGKWAESDSSVIGIYSFDMDYVNNYIRDNRKLFQLYIDECINIINKLNTDLCLAFWNCKNSLAINIGDKSDDTQYALLIDTGNGVLKYLPDTFRGGDSSKATKIVTYIKNNYKEYGNN